MAIRYVDADVLNDLAYQAARARGDLDILSVCGRAMAIVPSRGWNHGEWDGVRSSLTNEISLLGADERSLRDRAGRTRDAATQRALMDWLVGYWREIGSVVAGAAIWVGSDAGLDLVGLVVDGVDTVMSVGELAGKFAEVSFISLFSPATLSTYHDILHGVLTMPSPASVAIGAAAALVRNWKDYAAESLGTVVTGAVIDTVISIAVGIVVKAAIVTGVTLTLGALAALGVFTAPGWVVGGAALLAGVAAIWVAHEATGWVRGTKPYKDFVRGTGHVLDIASEAVVETVGTTVDAAVKGAETLQHSAVHVVDDIGRAAHDTVDHVLQSTFQFPKLDLSRAIA